MVLQGVARARRWNGAAASMVLTVVLAGCSSHSTPSTTGIDPRSAKTPAPPAHLLARAAPRVITPELGREGQTVYVGGLSRGLPATGVNDELFARAVVLSDVKGVSVGLVVLDLIGFFNDDVRKVREELRARHPEV